MLYSMTYGTMPTEEQYDRVWEGQETPEYGAPIGNFRFGNDKRMGTCELSQSELWAELKKAHAEFENGDEDAGDWMSCVLGSLGIEWI